MITFSADPGALADYQIDWSTALDAGDTILHSSWTVPDDLTSSNPAYTDTTTTIWLTGGVAGRIYTITNHVVTAAGREFDQSIQLIVEEQ